MIRALIVAEPQVRVARLEFDLKEVGLHVLGATNCKQLVQDTIRLSPDVVVAEFAQPNADFFVAATALESLHPVAIAAFTDDMQVESMERALAAGIGTWVIRGYEGGRLRPLIQLAMARFGRERQQREALAEMAARLEERKLVDRAKGILMSNARMAEDEAFRTLRDAAMQGRTRVGEVARQLIDAARGAEAINRSGQLRMLSQRLVKLTLLAALGMEPASAAALRRASIDRVAQNLESLRELLSAATFGDLLDGAVAAWRGLQGVMALDAIDAQAPDAPMLDAAAEQLLDAAEKLTRALEAASPIGRLQLVNLAGRQRMLAQRVAKLALLGVLAPGTAEALNAQMATAIAAFDAAMTVLRDSPQTTEPARAMLDAAQQAWIELCRRAQTAQKPDSQLAIAQSSEELLELFDRLAESYAYQLRMLVG